MENLQENTAEILNQLVEINNDRIEGYEKAIGLLPTADNYGLQDIFERHRDQSIQFNSDLKPLVAQAGEVPTSGTRTSGKIFRTWMEIKSAVAPYTIKAILESCERGEDEFIKVYEGILKNNNLDAQLHTVIQSQLSVQEEAHHLIKDLRDSSGNV